MARTPRTWGEGEGKLPSIGLEKQLLKNQSLLHEDCAAFSLSEQWALYRMESHGGVTSGTQWECLAGIQAQGTACEVGASHQQLVATRKNMI